MPILAAIGIGGPQLAGLFATTIFGRHTAKRAKKKADAVARDQAEAARAAMNLKFNTTSNVGNLPVVYGAVRMGGFYCLQEVSADKKFLHIVIAHAEGQCGAATMLYLDGTAYTDPKFKKKTKAQVKSGTVIEIRTPVNGPPYPVEVDRYIEQETAQDLVVWEYFDGADDQAACASLIAALPAKWTAAHKLSGVAYSYVRLEWNPDVWRAVPIITVDMTGKLVYDPRNGTTTASKNPALALRDYLLSPRYGRGLTVGGVNDSAIIAEANYCDQLIDMGHAAPVPRYAISGMIDTSKACLDNVQELMEHMRGSLLYIDDVYSLVLDKADVPVMSLDSDILVGKVQIKAADRRDKLNQLVGRFIDPARNFEESTVTLPNATWRAEDGGTLLESQRDYSLAYDERRARYLAVRDLRASRNALSLSFTALSQAQRLLPTDVISVSYETTGWVNKQFRVLTVKPLPSGDVEITAHEYDAGLYTDAPLSALPPPPATNLPDPFAILAAPASLVVTTDNQYSWAGEVQCRLKAVWPAVPGLVVDYLVRWRKQSEATWQSMSTRDLSALLPVIPNAPYFVSVAGVSALGRVGNAITVEASGVAPSGSLPDVTGLVCEFGPLGEFIFTWAKSADAVKYAIEISTGGITRRSDVIAAESYVYTLAMNTADSINRTVTIRIKAVSGLGLISVNWAEKTETNAVPAALNGLEVWSNFLAIAFRCLPPAETDVDGVMIHLSPTPTFTPSAETLAYKGRLDDPVLVNAVNKVPVTVGNTYYLRAAAYDVFGDVGLNYSSSYVVTITNLDAALLELGSIKKGALAAEIQDSVDNANTAFAALEGTSLPKVVGALPAVKSSDFVVFAGAMYRWDGTKYTAEIKSEWLAADIAAPKVVATKPITKVADVIFVIADKAIYRWDGTKYTDSVAVASLVGKVARSQLEDSVANDVATALGYNSRIVAVENDKASTQSVNTLAAKVAAGTSGNLLLNADFLAVSNGAPNAWSFAGNLPNISVGVNVDSDWTVAPALTANTLSIRQIGAGAGDFHYAQQTVAVEAGKTYALSVYSGAHRSRGWQTLSFVDAAGSQVGYAEDLNAEEAGGGKALTGYKRMKCLLLAPPTAVSAIVRIGKHVTAAGQADSWHFFTRPQLEIVPAGATQPTEWRTGQTDVAALNNAASKAELTASITTVNQAIVDATQNKAEASTVTNLSAAVAQNQATVNNSLTALADADVAMSTRIDNIILVSGNNSAAAIDAEAQARVAADAAQVIQTNAISARLNVGGDVKNAITAAATAATAAQATADGRATVESVAGLKARLDNAGGRSVEAMNQQLDVIAIDMSGKASTQSVNTLAAKGAAGTSGNLLLNADFLAVSSGMPNAWGFAGNLPNISVAINAQPEWTVTPALTANTLSIRQIGVGAGDYHYTEQSVAVEAGKTYVFSVYSGAHRARGWITLAFFDAQGVAVGYAEDLNAEEAGGGKALTGYKRMKCLLLAPPTAVLAMVRIGKHITTSGQADSWHFFTRPQLEIVPAGATQPTEWRTGQTDVAALNNAASKAELTASITTVNQAIVDATQNKAEASSVTSLAAVVDGVSSTASSALSVGNAATGKLASTWQVTLNAAGKIAGMKAFNDGATSAFLLSADQVLISNSSNLIPNTTFQDLAWWGFPANQEIETVVTPGALGSVRRAILRPGIGTDCSSSLMPVEAGAKYRIKLIAEGVGVVGAVNPVLHIPGLIWLGFNGVAIDPEGASQIVNGMNVLTGVYTMPENVTYGAIQIRIRNKLTAGYVRIGAVSITKMSSAELIVDGAVKTQHLEAAAITAEKLAALAVKAQHIYAGAVQAQHIAVANLAAITTSTGELYVSGNLHMTAGAILGGARAGWSWPVSGAQNMYLGPSGFLLGNYYAGKSLEYNAANGTLLLTGGRIVAGAIMGGAYSGYAWAAGGYYLGPEGMLLGNSSTGAYLQWDQASGQLIIRGNVQATSIAAGAITAGTITADHIVARGISRGYSGVNSVWYGVSYAESLVIKFSKGTIQGQAVSFVEYAIENPGSYNFAPSWSGNSPSVQSVCVMVFSR
ncbi:hypothetical protein [Deefgea rivuli]|uniref:hypothetical protein n=1 Tax=Deefgea rivuli TaxID=400948 RepID=UPI0004881A07|nr:hypothetical protein [Deefgea rivuli]